MVFVAHHADVTSVLTNEDSYSLCHYDPLYAAIAPPGATIIMRPEGPVRSERLAILGAAAATTPWFGPCPKERRAVSRMCVDNILAAVRRRRGFDLIAEYGFFAPYLIAKRVLGLTGPRSFSLLSLLICIANRHPLSLALAPETGPYMTDLAWSELCVLQLLGNFENRSWITRMLGRCGASRLRSQIKRDVDAFPNAAGEQTLLNALWAVRQDFPNVERDVYREHVVSIMTELGSTIFLVPGLGFTGILDRWLKSGGLGLKASLGRLEENLDPEEFVQEQLRLAPPSAHLLRNATAPISLGGLAIKKGEYVCALVKSAGLDLADEPEAVKAGRHPSAYLHFGPEGGPHRCFGHRIAPSILAEMFLGLTRLPGLAPRSSVTTFAESAPGRLLVGFGEPVGTSL